MIADGQAAGVFRAELNPTLAAKLFFGALDEMATNWILSRRRYSLVNEADAIVDLFVGGIAEPLSTRRCTSAQLPCSEPERWVRRSRRTWPTPVCRSCCST